VFGDHIYASVKEVLLSRNHEGFNVKKTQIFFH